MSIPLHITFRDMPHSDALEAYVRRHCDKLAHLAARITACRVTIAMPHQHQHTARPVRVSIDLALPGQEIAVNRSPQEDVMVLDAHSAIDQAFDQAVRRVHDFVSIQRGDVRGHESEYQDARVTKLWNYEGYGFLTTADDLDVYFHKNSVLHRGFERMKLGSKVRFIQEEGEKGPQASTVVLAE